MKYSSLAEFYKDRSLFVTGATGFMGKVGQTKYCEDFKFSPNHLQTNLEWAKIVCCHYKLSC
jgi:hypothetical protein